jgi:hypothetical protein
MAVLVALVLTLARPPAAVLDTGRAQVPLAISSWCWGRRCGAPIAASTRVAAVKRGTVVRAELRFVPTGARVAVAGRPVTALRHGRDVTWKATRAGGVTVRATSARGWVVYVGRIVLH